MTIDFSEQDLREIERVRDLPPEDEVDWLPDVWVTPFDDEGDG